MMISITSSQVTGEQAERVEAFLVTFLSRMRKLPGVIAIYHYASSEQSDEKTATIWEDEAALHRYRESDLVKGSNRLREEMEPGQHARGVSAPAGLLVPFPTPKTAPAPR